MPSRAPARIRNEPTRLRWNLRQAAERTGLPFQVYVKPGPDAPYFDIVFSLPNGKTALVHTYHRNDHSCHRNIVARERRLSYVKSSGVPYLELHLAPVDFMTANVEFWLANIQTTPVRLAPRINPYRPQVHPKNRNALGDRYKY